MTHSENQVLALAAIIQAASLVDQIARTGTAPSEQVNPLIQSIFEFDPPSTDAVFGGVHNLDEGLNHFLDLITGQQKSHNPAVVRYSLGILHLQKQASSQPGLFDVLHNRLSHASIKAEHFSNNINEITHTLSAIYQDTISTLKYRLHIKGSAQQLQNPVNADMIRALLLAGVRSAVLWRQLGGRRWHLFLARKRLEKAARTLLEH